jgi:hypothetical protein
MTDHGLTLPRRPMPGLDRALIRQQSAEVSAKMDELRRQFDARQIGRRRYNTDYALLLDQFNALERKLRA